MPRSQQKTAKPKRVAAPKVKKVRRKSDVWHFFNRFPDPKQKGGTCRLCGKVIRSAGNTTNQLNHLKRKHKSQWKEFWMLNNKYPRSYYSSDEDCLKETHVLHHDMDEDHATTVMDGQMENVDAVQALQAYASQDGGTVIFLQPAEKAEPGEHPSQNGDFQSNVMLLEHSVADDAEDMIAEDLVMDHGGADARSNTAPESDAPDQGLPRVKNVTGAARNAHTYTPGGRMATNYVLKRLTGGPASAKVAKSDWRLGRDSVEEEDSFDHFGRYLASLLRSLPSRKAAYKLQKEMISWALQEQLRLESS